MYRKLIPMATTVMVALLTASVAPAGANKGIEGIWQGKLKVGVVELRLVFKFKKDDKGRLTGTLDSIDQGAKNIPIEEVRYTNGKLEVDLRRLRARYNATMNADATELTGEFRQSGLKLPLKLKRVDKVEERRRPQLPKPPFPYRTVEVSFENKKAKVRLAGTLTLPKGKGPFPAVVLISGSGPQDRDETLFGHKPFLVLADYLTRRGVAVLRYDDRGVGGSTGKHSTATSEDFADDAGAAVQYLKRRNDIDRHRIGLIGHSEGGIIAPMVAARSRDVAFIVLLAGTAVPGDEVLYAQGEALLKAAGVDAKTIAEQTDLQRKIVQIAKESTDNDQAKKRIEALIVEAFDKLPPSQRQQIEDRESLMKGPFGAGRVLSPWMRFFIRYDPRPTLRQVRCPVLALFAEKDLQVLPDQNAPAMRAALKAGGNPDFTIEVLPGLNHLFQTCNTGSVSEYGRIEETFAPAALQRIGDWIAARTRQQTPHNP